MIFRHSNLLAFAAVALLTALMVSATGAIERVQAGDQADAGASATYTPLQSPQSPSTYDGRLRVYLVEPTSRWKDKWKEPFRFGFLDWSVDSVISLSYGDTIDITADWYAPDHGFAGITESNIMAIAAVFNSEGHERFSWPDSLRNPFTAHYVDATAGATPGSRDSNRVAAGFTHTVLTEKGTTTKCQYCPYVSASLDAIYLSGKYPFFFVTMIADVSSSLKDSLAFRRMKGDYNLYAYPTCYTDGGYEVRYSAALPVTPDLEAHIEASGARAVTGLDLHLSLEWVAENTVRTHVTVSLRPKKDAFMISLLPNPVLPFELDVLAFPSAPLASDPRAIIESASAGDVDTLTMTELADRDRETYAVDYRLQNQGNYTVSVCGQIVDGDYDCSDLVFSGAPIHADEGGSLPSYSGAVDLSIPPGTFPRDALLICYEHDASALNTAGFELPPGTEALLLIEAKSSVRTLKAGAVLTVDLARLGVYGDDAGSVVVLHAGGTGLTRLSAEVDRSSRRLTAEITEIGTWVIGRTSSAESGSGQVASAPPVDRLHQNRPNPFNAVTTIYFELPEASWTKLSVYNILGQRVVTLLDQYLPSGTHGVAWDGRNEGGGDCGSGVYFYRMETNSFRETRRMLLLK